MYTPEAVAATLLAAVVALTMTLAPAAQTQIVPPKNSFKPEQDVQLGQRAAQEVRRQYPLLRDEQAAYVKIVPL